MIKILLVCYSGVSSSILMDRVRESAHKKEINILVEAVPKERIMPLLNLFDIVLLGPQIANLLDEIKETTQDHNYRCEVIPAQPFKNLDGEAVLEFALDHLTNHTKSDFAL